MDFVPVTGVLIPKVSTATLNSASTSSRKTCDSACVGREVAVSWNCGMRAWRCSTVAYMRYFLSLSSVLGGVSVFVAVVVAVVVVVVGPPHVAGGSGFA